MNSTSSNTRYLPLLAILMTTALGMQACGPAVEPLGEGTLSLTWEVLPGGCEDEGVERIEVSFEPARGANPAHVFDCDQQAATIDLIAGQYTLESRGLDARGRAVVEATPREVSVRDGYVTRLEAIVELTAIPGSVEVEWQFEDGRVCGAHGVSQVELTVFDDASFQVARERFSCNDGAGVIDGLPQQSYLVLGRAIGSGGDVSTNFEGVVEVGVKRGSESQASLVLGVEAE